MRVLKTFSGGCRDRLEARRFDLEELRRQLAAEGLVFPDELLVRLGAAARQGGLVLLHGPSGAGKTALAMALARHLTRGYRDRGFARIDVRPDWRSPVDLVGSWDEHRGQYRVPPFLELWLRALRHKAKTYLAVLDGLDRAPPQAYLAEILAAGEGLQALQLHADHLRCQPRQGLSEELTNFFICHQDCSRCFFVTAGYPQGVTEAVKDFVPARVQRADNLIVVGTLEGPPEALPPLLRDRAWLLEVPRVDVEMLREAGLVPTLSSGEIAFEALARDLRDARISVSPRRWRRLEDLLAAGEPWATALELGLGEAWHRLPEESRQARSADDPELVLPTHDHEGGEQGQPAQEQASAGDEPVVQVELGSEDGAQPVANPPGEADPGIEAVESRHPEPHQEAAKDGVQEECHASKGSRGQAS